MFIETTDMSVGWRLDGQLRHLVDNGYRVVVTASEDTGRLVRVATDNGALHIRVPMRRTAAPLSDLAVVVRLYIHLRRVRPAIVNYGTPKAALLGALAAWAARVPVRVYTCHGLRLETMTGNSLRFYSMVERICNSLSTETVYVSQSLADEARRRGLLAERANVLGAGSINGVNVERFSFAGSDAAVRARVRARHGWGDEDTVVGFVGRLTPDKGIDDLVAAFEGLPEGQSWRLALVGPPEGLDSLTERTRRLLVEDTRITLLGEVDDVEEIYAAMDVFCLPSRREGLSTVVLEAAAARVPVVATRATGISGLLTDGVTARLLDIGDVAGLRDAIAACRGADAARMADAAYDHVTSSYLQEQVWANWLQYYRQLEDRYLDRPADRREPIR